MIDRKYQDYLLTAIVYLVIVVVVVFGVVPLFSALLTTREQLVADQQTITELSKKRDFLTNLDKAILGSDLNIAETALPADKTFAGLYSGLGFIIASMGGTLDEFIVSPGVVASSAARPQEKKVGATEFRLTMHGDHRQLPTLVKNLTETTRLVGFRSLDYDRGETILVMDGYYQQLRTNLGEVTTPLADLTLIERAAVKTVAGFNSFLGLLFPR